MLPIGISQLVGSTQWLLEPKERKRFDPLSSRYTEQVDDLLGLEVCFSGFSSWGCSKCLGASDVNGFNILEKIMSLNWVLTKLDSITDEHDTR